MDWKSKLELFVFLHRQSKVLIFFYRLAHNSRIGCFSLATSVSPCPWLLHQWQVTAAKLNFGVLFFFTNWSSWSRNTRLRGYRLGAYALRYKRHIIWSFSRATNPKVLPLCHAYKYCWTLYFVWFIESSIRQSFYFRCLSTYTRTLAPPYEGQGRHIGWELEPDQVQGVPPV